MSCGGNINYNYEIDCQATDVCGCKTKLSSLCIIYQSKDLKNINVERGDNLEFILKQIDAKIKSITDGSALGQVIANIGTGAKVFKQETPQGVSELRSINGSDSISVTEGSSTIDLKVNDTWINGKLQPLETSISDLETRVSNIENQLGTIGSGVGAITKTKVTEVKGQSSVNLGETPKSIVQVSFCGAVLPREAYTVSGNIVNLSLSQYDIGVDANEVVRVIYEA